MSSTYREPVLRYRVMKQLNDAERNPNGDWSLFYSTNNAVDAKVVADEQRDFWKRCGDKFKIVDAGETTYIERSIW